MLAEKLLLEKDDLERDGRRYVKRIMPVAEAQVIKGLEALREPPGIVHRRRARMYAIDALGYVTDSTGQYALTNVGALPPEMFDTGKLKIDVPDPDVVGRLGFAEGTPNRIAGGGAMHVPITPEMAAKVPPSLLRYLTDETEHELGVEVELFLKHLMATGGLYRVDGGELGAQGVLDSIWGGLPFTELPPLPYPRMWFEARDEAGNYVPLWRADAPEGAWNGKDAGTLWGMGISEVDPGRAWAIIAVRQENWAYLADTGDDGGRWPEGSMLTSLRYERVDVSEMAVLDSMISHDALWAFPGESDRANALSEQAYRTAMLSWAVVLADMVTARNVDRREVALPRKTHKQLSRSLPGGLRWTPRVYEVSIATATGDAMDETGRSLSVRFMVRGHWRKSFAEHARWIDSKEAFCVWVTGHVKGPAGAPWKGRAVYVEQKPEQAKGTR